MNYAEWYVRRTGERLAETTRAAWARLEEKAAFATKERPLDIFVLAQDSTSPRLDDEHAVIDVRTRWLSAEARNLYNIWQVTGVDFDVQAVLAGQPGTPELLCQACRLIELQELTTFTFVCAHATHRSCGCALLLAILVYHNARIVFSSNRTERAARERGMLPV